MKAAVLLASLLTGWSLTGAAAEAREPPAGNDPALEFFESRIRPILAEHCLSCHGPEKQRGGLRLDSREGVLKGNAAGPVLIPGHPDQSRLIRAIGYDGRIKMPPPGKLPPEAIADLKTWVRMGAPWPQDQKAGTLQVQTPAEAWKNHWAFQPLRPPVVPAVKQSAWVRSPVDAFILARLEEKGLTPAPPADRRTLLRRATFDLIGLPPTPQEIADFEADRSPDAFARVIDRLLASPQYGERWGRYWLDVARYADTKGYVFTEERKFPCSYSYRDYVIRSFNEDLPYNQFILQQLAADQLPLGEDKRPLAAMGFLTLGNRFMNNPHDIIDDRIDVVTRGLLGLTVSCARCHDHKFDPIPTRDYYSLYGVFASCAEPTVPPLFADPPKTPQYLAFQKELDKREAKLRDFVRAKRKQVIDGAMTRVAEYLLAAHARRGQPKTDEFMLLADGN
ncbi:MAG: DUF1549 domain-containing protein, partial [Planctomycetes bacterium]|nr:DUF1549 domain-containing protein [Planctomycetota bacterium]